MALKQTQNVEAQIVARTDFGVKDLNETRTVEIEKYIKVERVEGDKNKAKAFVSQNGQALLETTFNVDLSGGNFIKQAYQHLKNLPEFNNAVDC
jgi:hypothetical protein